jgi:hypothetical protein
MTLKIRCASAVCSVRVPHSRRRESIRSSTVLVHVLRISTESPPRISTAHCMRLSSAHNMPTDRNRHLRPAWHCLQTNATYAVLMLVRKHEVSRVLDTATHLVFSYSPRRTVPRAAVSVISVSCSSPTVLSRESIHSLLVVSSVSFRFVSFRFVSFRFVSSLDIARSILITCCFAACHGA